MENHNANTSLYGTIAEITTTKYPPEFQSTVASCRQIILDYLDTVDRKKWQSRADFIKELYSVLGAALVLYSCTTDGGVNASLGLLVTLLLGPGWNLTNIVSGLLSLPDLIENYKKEPTKTNLFLLGSSVVTLIALAGGWSWGMYSTLSSAAKEGIKKVFLVSSKTLGGVYALALGLDGAFCLGQLSDAAKASLTPPDSKNSPYIKPAIITGELTSAVGAFFAILSMLLEPRAIIYLSGVFYSLSACIKMTLAVFIPYFCKACCYKPVENTGGLGLFSRDAGSTEKENPSIQHVP